MKKRNVIQHQGRPIRSNCNILMVQYIGAQRAAQRQLTSITLLWLPFHLPQSIVACQPIMQTPTVHKKALDFGFYVLAKAFLLRIGFFRDTMQERERLPQNYLCIKCTYLKFNNNSNKNWYFFIDLFVCFKGNFVLVLNTDHDEVEDENDNGSGSGSGDRQH